MPLPTVARLLSEAGRGGLARQAHFHVMGEPLLYPDLAEAVRIAHQNGLEAWVTTNGSLLTPGVLVELAEAGLAHLSLSLQTPDAATFALRGARRLAFEAYRERVVAAVRAAVACETEMRLSICFLANPLRRFRAPDAPRLQMAETGRELHAHMGRWVEWIFGGTERAADIPRLLARTRRAGVLREGRIPMTERLDFRVRVLGNWAGHFEGSLMPATFGYCPGLLENLGVLWNGDYVICCTDYDGHTVLANASETTLREYLALPRVQEIAGGFRRCRVVHPHCRRCLGDRSFASALARQVGSILYFKVYRGLRDVRYAAGDVA